MMYSRLPLRIVEDYMQMQVVCIYEPSLTETPLNLKRCVLFTCVSPNQRVVLFF